LKQRIKSEKYFEKEKSDFRLRGLRLPFRPSVAGGPARACVFSLPLPRAHARAWRRGAAAAFGRRVAARRRSHATRALWPPQRPRPLTPSARSFSSLAPSILPRPPAAAAAELRLAIAGSRAPQPP
jgi:hypothetical protein